MTSDYELGGLEHTISMLTQQLYEVRTLLADTRRDHTPSCYLRRWMSGEHRCDCGAAEWNAKLDVLCHVKAQMPDGEPRA